MNAKNRLKAYLGIHEWLYFSTFRTGIGPDPVWHERRVDLVTGSFQRAINGEWQGRINALIPPPFAQPWADDLYSI